MHNTSDCCKYGKDGKPKQGFGKGQHGSTAPDKKMANAFPQLSAKIAKLEKANKKLKKSSKKRKCEYNSDSSDSDSSLQGRFCSTWGHNCSQFMLTNSTQLNK